tara:strand:- start:5258 stop:6706 length:1449 start_codon:yes stop_codon:yes gene_type:complete
MKNNDKNWSLQNSYLELPDCFYERIEPTLVQSPKIIYFNKDLAKNLNLEFLNHNLSLITNYFSGNKLPKNSKPIAQAYAGHQFGHFTMLGDGRAILLGEQKDSNNNLYDIQLKGSGKTSFSRGGDGRATLSSMLREYIISESMHYLKIPTTRSLAVIDTGEKVYRESASNGGILTRIASSHIRVGTFEYGKKFCSQEDFQNFINYVINRHYPKISNNKSPYLELLKLIMKKQIDLIINWIRVGFIHGVMNTDNMSISGETIDYGPCAFINTYNPKTVFSSIDRHGRYAFGNQHNIAYWNLAALAGTILPFIANDKDQAIQLVQDVLNQFPIEYSNKWHEMMYKKLGITDPIEEDKLLIRDLLTLMESYKADYTNTFAALTLNKGYKDSLFTSNEFNDWKKKWEERTKNDKNSYKIMQMNNPIYIPRNHLVESALKNATDGNKKEFDELLNLMSNTYNYNAKHNGFQTIPKDFDKSYKTFCGT